jgi:hypothetical protein
LGFSTLIGIFTLRGCIGTLELEVLSTNLHHLTIDFPETIANINDLVGIGEDFVLVLGCEILRVSISIGALSIVACGILYR